MSLIKQVGGRIAGRRSDRRGRELARAATTAPLPGPFEIVNDAEAYGVTIQPAAVPPGVWYWQAILIHHLDAKENAGNHHLRVDLVQRIADAESGAPSERITGAQARITWAEGDETITLDSDRAAAGGDISHAMWQRQTYSVEALGLPGEQMLSDRVIGLHTGHTEEQAGNTLFHHSFRIIFCKAQAPQAGAGASVIQGVVRGAGGHKALLLRGDTVVAKQDVAEDEVFRFTDLSADVYVVAVEETPLRSGPVTVDGQNQARIELSVSIARSAVSGRVEGGAGRTLTLERGGTPVANQVVGEAGTYQFTGLSAGSYELVVAGTPIRSGELTLSGSNAVTADLRAPAATKLLAHYVLFGPASEAKSQVHLLLARDYLLAFGFAFGFSTDEAAAAGIVTIVADTSAVSQQVQDRLQAGGGVVQRISGSVPEVAAALTARVASGRPLS